MKNNFYVTSHIQLQKRKHKSKTYAWHILVEKQQQEEFEMVQSMVTHTHFMFTKKIQSSQDPNPMAEMGVKYASTRRLTS
jgi:hypothetical protein